MGNGRAIAQKRSSLLLQSFLVVTRTFVYQVLGPIQLIPVDGRTHAFYKPAGYVESSFHLNCHEKDKRAEGKEILHLAEKL